MEVNATSYNYTNGNNTNKNKKGSSGIMKLRCSVQKYDWGRIGPESSVARLYALNGGGEVEDDKPYAEFWMGTHGSGPSHVVAAEGDRAVSVNGGDVEEEMMKKMNYDVERNGGVTLKTWIERNPSVLGDKVLAKWGPNLPFLFKVLSVAKALSIQAHPDKKLAEELHKRQPNVYKDDNHKPEMALAVTEFEALCGFVSLEELKEVIENVPEIVKIVGRECADEVLDIDEQDGEEKAKDVLRSLFTELMSASKDVISQELSKLISRLKTENIENEGNGLTEKEKLVLRLEKQYPADVGVIAAFLLNHVKLRPGEALHLGANEPHAYIYGECIECMATSDNVVRAGLTPKDRDVQILCSMLTYKQGFPDILQGVAVDMFTTRYIPPFEEFEVDRCVLPEGKETVFPALPSPSIFLVMEGGGTMRTASCEVVVTGGDVLFTPADTEVTIASTTSEGLRLYRAGVNSSLLE